MPDDRPATVGRAIGPEGTPVDFGGLPRRPDPRSPPPVVQQSPPVTPAVDALAPAARTPWLAGDIAPPARASAAGIACIVTVFVLYSLTAVLPPAIDAWVPVGLAVATAAAIAVRATFAVHMGLIALLHFVAYRLPFVGSQWPLNNLTALAAYALLVAAIPPLRATSGWLRRGGVDRTTRLAIAGFSAASATALVVWRFATHADVSRFRAFVPPFAFAQPPAALVVAAPIGIVLLSMANAAFEEVLWRGVIMQSLESAFGRGTFVCILQAVGFGVWHFRGFPSGVVGSVLTAIFALMMGILRMRGRGMLAPFVAHVCADATICALVAAMVFLG
jgi:membrane protease YdiL (CAAX protease family)